MELAIQICDNEFPVAAGAFRGSLAIERMERGELADARRLIAEGEPRLRGVHALELAKFLCRKARVDMAGGDAVTAQAALDEAEALAAEIDAEGNSDFATALAAAREALSD